MIDMNCPKVLDTDGRGTSVESFQDDYLAAINVKR